MSIGDKTVKTIAKSEFFDYKVFPKSVFRKFAPPRNPPRTPPRDASGGTTEGASPPTTTGKGKNSKANANSHTPTGRRILTKCTY